VRMHAGLEMRRCLGMHGGLEMHPGVGMRRCLGMHPGVGLHPRSGRVQPDTSWRVYPRAQSAVACGQVQKGLPPLRVGGGHIGELRNGRR